MSKTQAVEWINKPSEGYVMNTLFSEENASTIMKLVDTLNQRYGSSVFCMPKESLHITLLDLVAPLVDYGGKNKQALFKGIYGDYDAALSKILAHEQSFDVVFDTLHVAPTTIFISGHDNGQFERIRNKYLDTVELLPGTKRPPRIIHSSLARFTEEIDLAEVEEFIASQSILLQQPIKSFQLVHTFREPMLEFEALKTYSLT